MRYESGESSVLVGKFTPGTAVTIKVLDIHTNTLVPLSDDVCTESAIPGIYLWELAGNDVPTNTSILYMMTNGREMSIGKLVYGGFPDAVNTRADEVLASLTTVKQALGAGNSDTKVDEIIRSLKTYYDALYSKVGSSAYDALFKEQI